MTNRQISKRLTLLTYIIAMAVFAVLRLVGVTWFVQVYVEIGIPHIAEQCILAAYLLLECTLVLRLLTPSTWRMCLICAAWYVVALHLTIYRIPMDPNAQLMLMFADVIYVIGLPLALSRTPWSLIRSACYIAFAWVYSGTMMYARGYPDAAKYNAAWQIASTLDYKVLLIILVSSKEMIRMWGSGCLLWFGRLSICQRIGQFVTQPFTRRHDKA